MKRMNPHQFEERLQKLAAELARPNEGFFGPDSMMWRVCREPAIYLGIVRAILMQFAHPKVAQGVKDHSQFRSEPVARTFHTLRVAGDVVFGDAETAIRAAAWVYTLHSRVRGTLSEDVPSCHDPSYAATDPDLLLWVYATLIDSLLFTHDTFLPPLDERKREILYQESKRFALLFGVEADTIPRTLDDFRAWLQRNLESDTVTVTETARQVAEAVLKTPSPIFWPVNLVLAAGTLPPKLQAAYGLQEHVVLQIAYAAGVRLIRFAMPRVPAELRMLPKAKRAERRCRATGPSGESHGFA